ncbi:MAG TPA: iron-sulfur cluster repair di-iron protein [Cyclobacteriaceae bacterium]|nr:iron-sulfur cluster repair di-iron protein [Cyclobacteriaceae bacterium]
METTTASGFENLSVAEMVIEKPWATQVFKKYNIDFCCGGNKNFFKTCEKLNLNAEQLISEINQAKFTGSQDIIRYSNWSTVLLCNFIVENHHTYVKNEIPEILRLLAKTSAAHSDENTELLLIHEQFNLLSEELLNHLEKEESVLFPLIQELSAKRISAEIFDKDQIKIPIELMEHEHELAGSLMKSIRSLSNNYMPPAHACPTFKATYLKLKDFDDDLMKHIHLENNILFKKVIEGELK